MMRNPQSAAREKRLREMCPPLTWKTWRAMKRAESAQPPTKDPDPDTYYSLSPKALRWYHLTRKDDAFCIGKKEAQELRRITAELKIDFVSMEDLLRA